MELRENQDYTVKEVATHFIISPTRNEWSNYLYVLRLIHYKGLKANDLNPRGRKPFFKVRGSSIKRYLESQPA
jgi:hypothetical protein